MKVLILTSFFLLTSCASYVQKMHRQIKRQEAISAQKSGKVPYQNPRQKRFYDPYNGYRGIPVDKRDARPIQNPITLGGPQRKNPPVIKRKYSKRYTAEDLKDNSENASLWSGKNTDSFLFVPNTAKKRGDVVIIEVLGSLKENITAELKRAFPEKKVVAKKKEGEEDKKEGEEPKQETKTAQKGGGDKVYDKISSIVIEEVNRDYLMVRGRKEVVFRDRKRYVELSAIVSRKSIKDNDTVSSTNLLEPKVTALRYRR